MNRRDFIRFTAASGAVLVLTKLIAQHKEPAVKFSDPDFKLLADEALNTARMKGASYADIRISRHRNQSISTREQRVTDVSSDESYGFGVRVLVAGTWGFAASNKVTREEVARIAEEATVVARANKVLQKEFVELAPVQAYVDMWNTPVKKDPFLVPVSEKTDLLLRINEEALKVKGASFCSSWMFMAHEHKFFASTEGSCIEQNMIRMWPAFSVTSVNKETGKFESRNSLTEPIGQGYECVDVEFLLDDARQAAEEVVRKHTARSVEPGRRDLVLHPTNLWLTIHESVGHPTELDRALGYEANFAGTSFLTLDKLGKLKFG